MHGARLPGEIVRPRAAFTALADQDAIRGRVLTSAAALGSTR